MIPFSPRSEKVPPVIGNIRLCWPSTTPKSIMGTIVTCARKLKWNSDVAIAESPLVMNQAGYQRLLVGAGLTRSMSQLFKLHSFRTVRYRKVFSVLEKKGLGLLGVERSLSSLMAASS